MAHTITHARRLCYILVKGDESVYAYATIEYLGASFNGRTKVSKTLDVGSIPPAPAKKTRSARSAFCNNDTKKWRWNFNSKNTFIK